MQIRRFSDLLTGTRLSFFLLLCLLFPALSFVPVMSVSSGGRAIEPTSSSGRTIPTFIPPTISISNPSNSSTFLVDSTVTLGANASDSDGTIIKVEFFQGATKLGEDLTAPYSFDWTNVPAGTYSLTARATDNANEITNSSAVNMTVIAQSKQYVGWATISNGTDLGNGSVRKTSTGVWDFWALSTQTLTPGDAYFESTASQFNQSFVLTGSDNATRVVVIGTGGWAAIQENGVEVADTYPRVNITPHVAGDRYRIEIAGSALRYIRSRGLSREVMYTSTAPLPAYPIVLSLSMSPQNAEWQKSVYAQLTRKSTWSTISNGIDLGNGTVRKTSPGSWDFLAVAAQKSFPGDSYFESTAAAGGNQSIALDGTDGQSRYLLVGTGTWVGIYENNVEVAATCCRSPAETIPVHAAGDRYRLEISNGKLLYVKYRAGVRTIMFTSNAALPSYPYTSGLHSSPQNAEWQNSVVAQLMRNATWSSITNGIDLGNGTVRKTSAGSWDFSAGARQQLVSGNGYFESTASYYNQAIELDGTDGQSRYIVVGTGSWAGIYENGVEVASTCCRAPSETIAPHVPGDRYRLEVSRGKVRYVRYRSGVRSLMFTGPSALPAYPYSFRLVASFQNSEWQNTVCSDNVAEYNDAVFVSQTVPTTLSPGQSTSVTVSMRNTGTSTWTPDGDYQLTSDNLPDNQTWGPNRVNLTSVVPPGSDGVFNFTVTAPTTPGAYNFQWRMLQQNVQRFGALSTNLSVTTVNGPPTVTLTSPANNATFNSGSTVPLNATASDSDGTITKVEFFQGSVKLGEDTTSPYSFSWTNVAAGNYVLTARATDNGGAIAASTSVSIAVITPNQPPTVNLTYPTTGLVFDAPANITLTADANDSDGMVTKVQFYNGTTFIGEDFSAPFNLNWNNVAAGSYNNLTAKATDNAGATVTSAAVAIVVNTLPTVSITSPTHPTTLLAPANVTISASATDPDGSISKVEFFAGASLLGEDTTSPYSFSWNNAGTGSYALTAKATDNRSGAKTSSIVSLTVTDAPTTSVTNPANGSAFIAGSNVLINAVASDDGAVTKVEFFKNGIKLGEDTTAPYSFTWNSVPAGGYVLTTRATDDFGITGTSTPVNINVIVVTGMARVDPMNRTGGGGEDPLSLNYNWSVPLLSLPGRAGLDLGLSLSYNSLVWTKSSNYISFDDDRGFPGPGFRLGFPVIQAQYFNSEVSKNAFLLITPDGGHVELRQVGALALYEAADSSHLLLNSSTMVLSTTDGTQLKYVLKGTDFQCTEIKDRNGNFITVNYTNFGRIDNIVDTVGRTIKFNYNTPDNTLTSISQNWVGQSDPHVWASFTYTTTEIHTNFIDVTKVGPAENEMVRVLRSVTLNDNSTYVFDYTTWAQVSKISNYAADAHLLNSRAYNLPADANYQYQGCPRFTERRDWAENWNRDNSITGASGLPAGPEAEVVTASWDRQTDVSWTVPNGPQQTGIVTQITSVDGSYNKIYFQKDPDSGWQRGLISFVDTFGRSKPNDPIVRQRSVVNKWTQTLTTVSYIQDPRVEETNVYDYNSSGVILNRARTRFTYQSVDLGNGMTCHLQNNVYEYQADPTIVLRRAYTEYKTDAPYISRRILGLVSEKFLYEINPITQVETLKTQTGFAYDGAQSIVGNDAPVQHDPTYDLNFVVGRGNLTSLKRHNVIVTGQSTEIKMKFNTAGAPVVHIDASTHEQSISYADSYSDGTLDRNTFAYATSITDADTFTSTAQYNFDIGAVTRTQTPAPADQTVGAIKAFTYDSKGWLVKVAVEFGGNADYSHTRFVYPDSQNRVDSYVTVQQGMAEAFSSKITDGHGRVIAALSDHPGSNGGYSAQLMLFDKLGRMIKSSNPTETNAIGTPVQWSARGDDDPTGWFYTQQTYDWKGRPLVSTNQDTSTKTASYAGCGCAGGQVLTLTDELGRRQKIYSDVLGRSFKTEILNWDDEGVYSTTVTKYDARDLETEIKEYAGPEGSSPSQVTTLTYDGYGRLETKHVPQQAIGTSTVWTYNADDTVNSVTDPRGASQTFTYNNRHLRAGITYAAPSGISKPANVTYTYDGAGNRSRMTDGFSEKTYHYDSLSRLTQETRQLPVGSFSINYSYNLSGQLMSVTDPFGASFSYTRDARGQLKSLTGSPYAGTTNYVNNVSYRAWGAPGTVAYPSTTSTISFSSRMQPKQFRLLGNATGSSVMRENYSYYADGRIATLTDLDDTSGTNPPSTLRYLSRGYNYDNVGRIKSGFGLGNAGQGTPYSQTYAYDQFGNLTGRSGVYYSYNSAPFTSDTATYTNNRRANWGYDFEGQVTSTPTTSTDPTRSMTYDAVGRMKTSVETSSFNTVTYTASYDGDGQLVQESSVTSPGTSSSSYIIRSTVLGGEVLTRLDQSGNKLITHVPAEGLLFATQRSSGAPGAFVNFTLRNPLGISETSRAVYDPLGNYIPYQAFADPRPPAGSYNSGSMSGLVSSQANANSYAVGCVMDGMPTNCNRVRQAIARDQAKSVGILGLALTPEVSRLMISFAAVGAEFRPSSHTSAPSTTELSGGYGYTSSIGSAELWTLYIIAPGVQPGFEQNKQDTVTEKSFSDTDRRAMRAQLAKIATPLCQKFLDKLLTTAGDIGKDPAVMTNIVDLFDKVSSQGGFASATDGSSRGYSSISGAVGAPGGAKVLLSSTSDLYSPRTRILYHAYNALSELTHVAGSKPSYYAKGAFSDYNLGRVAFDVANEMGTGVKNLHLTLPTVDPNNDPYGRWSDFYHGVVKLYCKRD